MKTELVPVWKIREEVVYGTTVAELAAWCEQKGINPANADIIADVVYAADGPVVIVEYEVPADTPGAHWAGFRMEDREQGGTSQPSADTG